MTTEERARRAVCHLVCRNKDEERKRSYCSGNIVGCGVRESVTIAIKEAVAEVAGYYEQAWKSNQRLGELKGEEWLAGVVITETYLSKARALIAVPKENL